MCLGKDLEMACQMLKMRPDEVARNGVLGKNTSARGISRYPFAFHHFVPLRLRPEALPQAIQLLGGVVPAAV